MDIQEAIKLHILEGCSCAFGVFDGLHIGHKFLIDAAIADAKAENITSVVLTFDKDPDELFRASILKKISSNETRIAMLEQSGVDAVVVLPFTFEFASQEPVAFLESVFPNGAPSYLHVGADFRFGKKASGNVSDLSKWGVSRNMTVNAHELLDFDGEPVSATRIRRLLAECNIDLANKLLGRTYSLTSTVVKGRGEGHSMGFATANVVVPPSQSLLGDGVYAAYAYVDGVRYKAAVSMGVAPTFADVTDATCEAHLLDYEGDLYGSQITLEFVAWLREMRKFDSMDELIATVMGNIDWVRQNL